MNKILSSGIIPIVNGQEPMFLLLRCFKYWDFPKGQVEQDEDPRKAALRELKEETGIGDEIKISRQFYITETYSHNKTARYYLGEFNSQPEVNLLPNPQTGIYEHHEYRWVTMEEGLKLVVPRIKKVFYWAESIMRDRSTPR